MPHPRSAVAALVFALACAGPALAQQAQPSPMPTYVPPTPAPLPSPIMVAEDPKIHKLAVQQFLAWQQGAVDRTLYTDDLATQLTDDVISQASATLANLGALQSATFRGISHTQQADLYVYHMVCDRGAVDEDFALDPKGRILRIYFN